MTSVPEEHAHSSALILPESCQLTTEGPTFGAISGLWSCPTWFRSDGKCAGLRRRPDLDPRESQLAQASGAAYEGTYRWPVRKGCWTNGQLGESMDLRGRVWPWQEREPIAPGLSSTSKGCPWPRHAVFAGADRPRPGRSELGGV